MTRWAVLGRLLKKKKPRVFLGALAVAPRTDLKRYLDEYGLFEDANLESALREGITEIFSLPSAQSAESPLATDLVLDVLIPKFQSGDAWEVSLGDISLPIFWRPKITVAARLHLLKTEEIIATFTATEQMKLGQFWGRIFTWRAFLHFKPVFDRDDMERLLYLACKKLQAKIKRSI
jgi:hypothetical protein